MGYIATIQRVADRATVDVAMPYEWFKGEHTDQFWWEEGNFACDCNRAGLMGDDDESCGDSRYLVTITLPDGSVPYDELAGAGL